MTDQERGLLRAYCATTLARSKVTVNLRDSYLTPGASIPRSRENLMLPAGASTSRN
jgi:hypothetical protein